MLHGRWLPRMIVSVAAALWLTACERATESQVASLDNFVRAPDSVETSNTCAPRFEAPSADDMRRLETDADGDGLRHEASRMLAAVPPSLRRVFFSLGGRISITARAPEICASPHACWRLDANGAPVVYINAAPGSVRHAGVRAFGYVLSQMITRVAVQDGAARYVPENERFDAVKSEILASLERDIKASDGRYDLEALNRLAPRERADYAFAEAFDSYYCSPQSRLRMARDFRDTHRAFVMIAHELETQDEGLSLTFDFIGILGSLFSVLASGGGGGGGGGLVSVLGGLLPLLMGGTI